MTYERRLVTTDTAAKSRIDLPDRCERCDGSEDKCRVQKILIEKMKPKINRNQ
jgi:hypothetical protein